MRIPIVTFRDPNFVNPFGQPIPMPGTSHEWVAMTTVALPHVQGRTIDVRIDGDRPDAHLAQSANDANGDLATIGDEDFAHRD